MKNDMKIACACAIVVMPPPKNKESESSNTNINTHTHTKTLFCSTFHKFPLETCSSLLSIFAAAVST